MTMTRIPHSVSLTFNPLVDVSWERDRFAMLFDRRPLPITNLGKKRIELWFTTFSANVAISSELRTRLVSITIFYFATELANCTFTSVYPEIYVHWKIPFQKGPFSSESKSKCMWPAQEQIKLKLIKHHPKMGNYQFLCTGEKSTGLMGCYHSYSF
nr:hypothetical protein CFP56_51226 [Quercus suber]